MAAYALGGPQNAPTPWHNREMTVAAFPVTAPALGLWALVQLVVASAAALGRAIVNAERWGMHNARRLFVAAAAALAPLLAQLGTWIVAVLKMAWGWLASLPRHLVRILHFLWQMTAGLRHAVTRIWHAIGRAIGSALERIGEAITWVFELIAAAIQWVFDGIGRFLHWLFSPVVRLFRWMGHVVQTIARRSGVGWPAG
ncbi:MAG: hypothetical protein IPK19_24310 [Chloroflexi bacterium]|nr:hypothetical protein [Chloroflexota bacterium]